MRLYYFTTAEHGLMAIRDRRLKIAEIDKLNDPFEFLGVSLKDRDARWILKKTKETISKAHGLICMSLDWQHPLMWAHYASNHTGICLGFDVNEMYFEEVIYIDHLRDIDIKKIKENFEISNFDSNLIKRTKYTGWSYEKEYRAYIKLAERDAISGLYFEPFGAVTTLKDIIVGANSKVSRQQISQCVNGLTNLNIFKARPAFNEFKVVENKRASAWK